MMNKRLPKRSGNLRKLLSFMLVVIVSTSLLLPVNPTSAYATPTSAEKQAEADEVSATLAAAEKEMLQLRDDYWEAVKAHDTAVASMEEAQGRIDAAQSVINESQLALGNRANQMYRNGSLSFLDVIFGASSFEEFTTSLELINAINQENAKLIQANKDARAEAQAAHDEYSVQEQAAAVRQEEAEALTVRAETLVVEQQALLDSLEAEVAELVEQEEEARRAAEAAAAEAAAAAAAAAQNSGYNPPPDIPSGGYPDVVAAAASRLGCPYVWAASGPDTFDCSGLTSWSYLQAGRGWIGRADYNQYSMASSRWPYSSGGAAPGDVLWWPGHVAIYAGSGSYIHAPTPGDVVSYSSWNIDSATVLRF